MDKPSKLNERLTLIANLSVVVGIIFLAVELQQNTQAIEAQTRDSITEKQMEFYSWVVTNPHMAELLARTQSGIDTSDLAPADFITLRFFELGVLREWENSFYQYQRSLFSEQEFEARRSAWEVIARQASFSETWADQRESFSADFRAEIDGIVAEVGG